ncbi:MAG: hypothetical protein ACXABK_01260 [Candidatus Heimdallarchaeaceae archaeon]|jgi:tRNA pseudouridine38-40 synthase
MRYLVKVFYDGKNYYGYQRQQDVSTIEAAIINALVKTKHIHAPETNAFKSASRTDRYVNSLGNTFAFNSEKEIIIDQINTECSKDGTIVCWAYAIVEPTFTPKYSKWKKYWYLVPFDSIDTTISIEDLKRTAAHFEGEHDFKLFCRVDHRSTKRRIDKTDIKMWKDTLIFEFVAQSFLWEQVRRIVAYILNYHNLTDDLMDIEKLLSDQTEIKELNLSPADPKSLLLVEHYYENMNWIVSEKALNLIKKKFKMDILEQKKNLAVSLIMDNFFEQER